MIKKVKISNIDCPNCAKALEKEINKIKIVKEAKLNFVKGTLTIESSDMDLALTEIKKLTAQIEPDAVIEDNTKNFSTKRSLIVDLITLLVGSLIGVICFLNVPNLLKVLAFVASSLIIGYKTVYKAFRLLLKGTINENLLVTLSIIGAGALGEYMEGLMVIFLYTLGKILEGFAVNKSRKSIKELTNLKPDYARLIVDQKEKTVTPEEVNIGDIILCKPGERVPLDGIVVEGSAHLNTQSLTGESLPVKIEEENEILSGSIVLDGVLKIKVTSKYSESTVSRILNLIENASEKKSKTETVISKIAKWYTLGVICLSIIVFGTVLLIVKDVNVAVYRALIFLLISCPCAFAISVPLSYFSGLGNASKQGILIKGSNYLDACAKLNIVAFDKTGTITTGEFEISEVKVLNKKYSREDVLFISALGEQHSLHPLAKAIVNSNTKPLVSVTKVKEIAGQGVSFCYNKKQYFVGKKSKDKKVTCVELYEEDEKIAEIYLKDAIKQNAKQVCKDLKAMGVKTLLLSGDSLEIVQNVANTIGVDEYHAKLLPQEKYEFVDKIKSEGKQIIGFVGDGINDAPSLTRADVGFSMGIKGSSSSIEASDIVLVDDNPNKVVNAIKISKFTRKIVWQNIIISAVIKATFLTLGALGITGMLWAVLADVGVTLVAILNSLRALKYKS